MIPRHPVDTAKVQAALATVANAKLRDKLAPLLACRTHAGGDTWSLEAFNRKGIACKDIAALLADELPVEVTALRLTNRAWKGTSLAQLVEHPAFAKIRMLDLYSCEKIGDGLAALAASPHAAQLETLGLMYCKLTPAQLATVRDAKVLRLRELDITSNKLRDPGAEVVGTAGAFPTVRVLRAGSNEGNGAWTEMLASASGTHLAALEGLDLEAVTSGDTSFGPSKAAWATFFAALAFRGLTTLELKANSNIDDAALSALAANPHLGSLASLDLRGIAAGRPGFEALAASKHVKPRSILLRPELANVSAGFAAGTVAIEA